MNRLAPLLALSLIGCSDVAHLAPAQEQWLTLPADARGEVVLRARGVRVAFALAGAQAAARSDGDGVAHYPGGGPEGSDLWLRVLPEGVEDYVRFAERPASEALRYRLDVRQVAGLRLVANTLELLDHAGVPRIRVAPPHLVDASGARHAASLALEGCAYDDDGAAPWHRPPTPPGSDRCDMLVRWRGAPYPLVVDPLWTTALSLLPGRWHHTATRLPNDDVLIAGGCTAPIDPTTICNSATSSTELRRYLAGEIVVATGPSLSVPRAHHTATLRDDGTVLLVGGAAASQSAADLATCDADGCDFTSVDHASMRRYGHAAAKLDGNVWITGGVDVVNAGVALSTAMAYTQNGWSNNLVSIGAARAFHTATALSDGIVLIGGAGALDEPLATATVLQAPAMTLASGGSMSQAKVLHAAVPLGGDRVLVSGGSPCALDAIEAPACDAETLSDAEIFDAALLPDANSNATAFVPVGNLDLPRQGHSMTLLESGWVLAAGGTFCNAGACSQFRSVEVYDPAAMQWIKLTSDDARMASARDGHTATPLHDGSVLVAGGRRPVDIIGDTVERFVPRSDGEICEAGGECASGNCVDGVCCASVCDLPCWACAAQIHGGADGQCLPAPAGPDPRGACLAEDAATCGDTGMCDGAGTCILHPAGIVCAPPACIDGDYVESRCNGDGACTETPTDCLRYACGADGCLTSCAGDEDCAPGAICVDGTCVLGCLDEDEAVDDEGNRQSCAPHRCRLGACLDRCDTPDDCVEGYLCDRHHDCVPPPPVQLDDASCACRAGPAPRPARWWWLLAAAIVALRRRT